MSDDARDAERVAEAVRHVLGAPPAIRRDVDIEQLVGVLSALVAAARAEERERWCAVRDLVRQQAEDESLWFRARTAPEAYLQQELRQLHAAVASS